MGVLRLLLAIAVIIAHCDAIPVLRPVSGSVAVEAFFIISGFYMSLILQEKYINKPYRLFITNRLLRIYPVYWGVLIATCLFCLIIRLLSGPESFPIFDQYLSVPVTGGAIPFLILTNLLIFGQDIVMFLGISTGTGALFFTDNFWQTSPPLYSFLFIPQAWSLGVEMLFYLIAPFLSRRRTIWIILLILLSLALRIYIYNQLELRHDPWTYRFFPTEILFFLSGFMSYRLYLKVRHCRIPGYINSSVLAYIILATTCYGWIPEFQSQMLPFSWNEIVYFLSVAGAVPLLFNYLKNSKRDNWIGQLSYPMYISHLLVARILYALPFSPLKHSWCIVTTTVIFSLLLEIFIARPVEIYRQKRLRQSPAAGSRPFWSSMAVKEKACR